jgi:hypothetical protein
MHFAKGEAESAAISERSLDFRLGQVFCFFAGRSSCVRSSGTLALRQSAAFSLTSGEAFGAP